MPLHVFFSYFIVLQIKETIRFAAILFPNGEDCIFLKGEDGTSYICYKYYFDCVVTASVNMYRIIALV